MVKVIPWITKCDKCDVRLEYDNEDVKTEEHEYYLYQNVTQKNLCHYIICPKCGGKVYLD